MDPIPVDSCSNNTFIKARDPSILAFNRPYLYNPNLLKNNLFDLDSELSTLSHNSNMQRSNDEEIEQLQVYLRIKPSTSFNDVYKISSDKKSLVCTQPNQQGKGTKDVKYTFSRIYGPEVGQKELFDHCVKAKLLKFINGNDSTFFAYGTSGAGKTFTILGNEDNPGIIPRALEYVFRSLPPLEELSQIKPANAAEITILSNEEVQNEVQFKQKIINSSVNFATHSVENIYKKMQQRLSTDPVAELNGDCIESKISIWISYYEIYNEYVYDLLCFDPKNININKNISLSRQKLQIHSDSSSRTYVKNLTNICVKNGLEAYKILQFGKINIQYGATRINEKSSRSHSIFTIKLVQYNEKQQECQISHFNFCDLAGSERQKKSNSAGFRLKESSNINHSLHVLGRCIKILRNKATSSSKNLDVVPYRESKLTRLFQPALSGKEFTSMIVNLNPNPDMFDENLHVLNFSSIAKQVSICNLKSTKVPIRYESTECSNETQRMLLEEFVQRQLEQQAREFREKEEQLRNMYVKKMQDQLMEMTALNKKKIEEAKERCEKRFKVKLENMEAHYKQQIMFYEVAAPSVQAEQDVIDLTNDGDDVEDREFEKLTTLVDQYEKELSLLKKQALEDKQKIEELESNLSKQLATLEFKYFESCKKNEQLELELKILKEENSDLQEQYSQLAISKQDQGDYVEELEDQLNATRSMIGLDSD